MASNEPESRFLFYLHLAVVSLAAVWSYASYVAIAKATNFWPRHEPEPPSFAASKDPGLLDTTTFVLLKFLGLAWLWVAFLDGLVIAVVAVLHTVQAFFSAQPASTLEKSRHVLSRILSYQCAILHLVASAIATLVVMTVPWAQDLAMRITSTYFWQSFSFLIASSFLLGVFQSAAYHDTTSGRTDVPYLFKALQFIGYLFLHAFVVYVTVGRMYIVAAVIARVVAAVQQKSWATWLSFLSLFLVNTVNIYLTIYAAKICIVAATPSGKSIVLFVKYYMGRQGPSEKSNVKETRDSLHLTASGLRDGGSTLGLIPPPPCDVLSPRLGFIASSQLLESMFENVPAKVIALVTTLQ